MKISSLLSLFSVALVGASQPIYAHDQQDSSLHLVSSQACHKKASSHKSPRARQRAEARCQALYACEHHHSGSEQALQACHDKVNKEFSVKEGRHRAVKNPSSSRPEFSEQITLQTPDFSEEITIDEVIVPDTSITTSPASSDYDDRDGKKGWSNTNQPS